MQCNAVQTCLLLKRQKRNADVRTFWTHAQPQLFVSLFFFSISNALLVGRHSPSRTNERTNERRLPSTGLKDPFLCHCSSLKILSLPFHMTSTSIMVNDSYKSNDDNDDEEESGAGSSNHQLRQSHRAMTRRTARSGQGEPEQVIRQKMVPAELGNERLSPSQVVFEKTEQTTPVVVETTPTPNVPPTKTESSSSSPSSPLRKMSTTTTAAPLTTPMKSKAQAGAARHGNRIAARSTKSKPRQRILLSRVTTDIGIKPEHRHLNRVDQQQRQPTGGASSSPPPPPPPTERLKLATTAKTTITADSNHTHSSLSTHASMRNALAKNKVRVLPPVTGSNSISAQSILSAHETTDQQQRNNHQRQNQQQQEHSFPLYDSQQQQQRRQIQINNGGYTIAIETSDDWMQQSRDTSIHDATQLQPSKQLESINADNRVTATTTTTTTTTTNQATRMEVRTPESHQYHDVTLDYVEQQAQNNQTHGGAKATTVENQRPQEGFHEENRSSAGQERVTTSSNSQTKQATTTKTAEMTAGASSTMNRHENRITTRQSQRSNDSPASRLSAIPSRTSVTNNSTTVTETHTARSVQDIDLAGTDSSTLLVAGQAEKATATGGLHTATMTTTATNTARDSRSEEFASVAVEHVTQSPSTIMTSTTVTTEAPSPVISPKRRPQSPVVRPNRRFVEQREGIPPASPATNAAFLEAARARSSSPSQRTRFRVTANGDRATLSKPAQSVSPPLSRTTYSTADQNTTTSIIDSTSKTVMDTSSAMATTNNSTASNDAVERIASLATTSNARTNTGERGVTGVTTRVTAPRSANKLSTTRVSTPVSPSKPSVHQAAPQPSSSQATSVYSAPTVSETGCDTDDNKNMTDRSEIRKVTTTIVTSSNTPSLKTGMTSNSRTTTTQERKTVCEHELGQPSKNTVSISNTNTATTAYNTREPGVTSVTATNMSAPRSANKLSTTSDRVPVFPSEPTANSRMLSESDDRHCVRSDTSHAAASPITGSTSNRETTTTVESGLASPTQGITTRVSAPRSPNKLSTTRVSTPVTQRTSINNGSGNQTAAVSANQAVCNRTTTMSTNNGEGSMPSKVFPPPESGNDRAMYSRSAAVSDKTGSTTTAVSITAVPDATDTMNTVSGAGGSHATSPGNGLPGKNNAKGTATVVISSPGKNRVRNVTRFTENRSRSDAFKPPGR